MDRQAAVFDIVNGPLPREVLVRGQDFVKIIGRFGLGRTPVPVDQVLRSRIDSGDDEVGQGAALLRLQPGRAVQDALGLGLEHEVVHPLLPFEGVGQKPGQGRKIEQHGVGRGLIRFLAQQSRCADRPTLHIGRVRGFLPGLRRIFQGHDTEGRQIGQILGDRPSVHRDDGENEGALDRPGRVPLVGALGALEIGHGPALEHGVDVLGDASAGTHIEGVDKLAVVDGHFPARLLDRPAAERAFGAEAEIDLGGGRGHQVEAEVVELAEVLQGIGPGGDGLGLLGFELVEIGRRQLCGDDALEIFFHIENIDQDEALAAPPQDEDPAVVAAAVREEALGRGGDEIERGIGAEIDELVVDRDPAGVVFGGRNLLPDDPGIADAQRVDLLDERQGVAAGQKIAGPDVENPFPARLPVLGRRDPLGDFFSQRLERGVGVLTLAELTRLDEKFLAQHVLASPHPGLGGIFSQKLIGAADLIDLHARGRTDLDVFDVQAQGDADDGLGDRIALEKEVFVPEFGRLSGQAIDDQEGQQKIFMVTGDQFRH